MKKSKILFTCLGTSLCIGAVAGVGISLASCSSGPTKGIFYANAGDPYKELDMMATTLDAVGYKVDTTGSKTFKQLSTEISTNTKKYVKQVSNSLATITGIPAIKDKTVAFIKNDSVSFTQSQTDRDKISALDKFHMEQPILYSSIYADKNDSVPGLGLKFPAPADDNGLRLFDNWFEIGAASLDAGVSSVSQDIANYWANTCDYVIYLYNSTNFTEQSERDFVSFIWNDANNEKLLAHNLLKSNAQIKKVIPLDIQFFYNSIFSVYGTENLTRLFTNLLTDSKDGTLGNDFGGLINGFKARPSTLPTFSIISGNEATWNKQVTPANKKSQTNLLTQPADFKVQQNNKTWNKIMSTRYNTITHLATLGIYPDIVQANGRYNGKDWNTDAGYQYRTLPGLIDKPLSSSQKTVLSSGGGLMQNTTGEPSATSNYKLVTKDFLKEPTTVIATENIYCVATERSNIGSFGNDWSDSPTAKPKPYATTAAKSSRNSGALSLEELIKSGTIATACYTERNDSEFTQTKYTLYVMCNNQKIDLKTYYSTRQDYVDLYPAVPAA